MILINQYGGEINKIVIIGLILCLFLIGIGVYFMNSNSSTNNNTTTITTLPTTISTQPATIITDGLVMNLINPSSSGNTWNDQTKNGNNATLINSPTYVSEYGGGYKLEGGQYITTNYNINTSNFTISVAGLFNPNRYWAVIWANESWNNKQGYVFTIEGNDLFKFYGGGTDPVDFTGMNYKSLSIFDFVINNNTITIYQNGVLLNSKNFNVPPNGFANNGLFFGARHTNDGSGYTDVCPSTYYSIRVYNVALNQSQISQNYNILKKIYNLP